MHGEPEVLLGQGQELSERLGTQIELALIIFGHNQ